MRVTQIAAYVDSNRGEAVAIVKVVADHHAIEKARSELRIVKAWRPTNVLRRWILLRLTGSGTK